MRDNVIDLASYRRKRENKRPVKCEPICTYIDWTHPLVQGLVTDGYTFNVQTD